MTNVVKLKRGVDVHKIRTALDVELFEYIYPFNQTLDSRHMWFAIVARKNNTTAAKIKNIFYGKSKLTSIERIYFEDKARHKFQTEQSDNVHQFSFYLRGEA